MGIIDKIRSEKDEKSVQQYNRFVVLTEEDKGYWEIFQILMLFLMQIVLSPQNNLLWNTKGQLLLDVMIIRRDLMN